MHGGKGSGMEDGLDLEMVAGRRKAVQGKRREKSTLSVTLPSSIWIRTH